MLFDAVFKVTYPMLWLSMRSKMWPISTSKLAPNWVRVEHRTGTITQTLYTKLSMNVASNMLLIVGKTGQLHPGHGCNQQTTSTEDRTTVVALFVSMLLVKVFDCTATKWICTGLKNLNMLRWHLCDVDQVFCTLILLIFRKNSSHFPTLSVYITFSVFLSIPLQIICLLVSYNYA